MDRIRSVFWDIRLVLKQFNVGPKLGYVRRARYLFAACLLSLVGPSFAADYYQYGRINNITTTTDGLMLTLDSGLPTRCTGTPYGWMLVPQASRTMVATVLALWLSGTREVTVYVNEYVAGNGYCTINQVDPA
jgi:hypothetical protein